MDVMERARFQISVASLLGLVACVALNIWLFRFGAIVGLIGLNITKHVLIAFLCKAVGVDRTKPRARPCMVTPSPAQVTVP
ncbi:MAG TPA: hypothetical protein VGZ22_20895 [Isosphaeraceae bacterium]|jgi:hypothetical protein|nr:hypothetical protein [Isosphaeraceae bacterium]